MVSVWILYTCINGEINFFFNYFPCECALLVVVDIISIINDIICAKVISNNYILNLSIFFGIKKNNFLDLKVRTFYNMLCFLNALCDFFSTKLIVHFYILNNIAKF